MNTFGSTPQYNGSDFVPGQKRLFHSDPEFALIKDKTVHSGFGILTVGTLMAVSAEDGNLVPYVTDDHASQEIGRSYAVADVATATAIVYITIDDSYKFSTTDHIILAYDDSGAEYHDGGKIVSIDRTSEPHRAKITFTTAIPSSTDFTTANGLNAYIKSHTSGKFSKAVWILDQDIDTGTGPKALGANTSVVISNAILYTASLVGYDSTAATDLGLIEDGQHVILK